MTLMLWLMLLRLQEPVEIIKVENQGRYLERIAFGRFRLCEDGSYLATTFHHVWHWDTDGKLINLIGGMGEGPNEFQAISEVLYTRDYYWVIDGARAVSKIFDAKGRFLHERGTPYRQFIKVEDRLFVVDRSGFIRGRKIYPPVLQEIRYNITPRGLEINNGPTLFKKITQRQMEMQLNFKQSWIVRHQGAYLVMDQLETLIRVYDEKALDREKNIPDTRSWEPDFIPAQLKAWIDPPDVMGSNFQNNKAMLRWWQSWSRINFFAAAEESLVVGYDVPDPESPDNALQALQRIAYNGEAMGEPVIVPGRCMGVKNDLAYVFVADESTSAFEYYVKAYAF